jgi:hypothetical protein
MGDPEILTRINSFEMAYRMQTSVPELMDISSEPKPSRRSMALSPAATFANNRLLARRFDRARRPVLQLFHRDRPSRRQWRPELVEGTAGTLSADGPAGGCVDQGFEATRFVEDTLVIWGGEFGRTPMLQGEVTKTMMGRDHHPRAYSIGWRWRHQTGITFGTTDELGYNVTENPVHIHDFQATVLHLLGLEHTKLTYRFQGRDFRLTDVSGKVVAGLLA